MYDAFQAKNDLSHLSRFQRCVTFVREKWPYVLHHVALFTFGYLVVVVGNTVSRVEFLMKCPDYHYRVWWDTICGHSLGCPRLLVSNGQWDRA